MIIKRIKYILSATALGAVLLCTSTPLVFAAASQSQTDACAGLTQLDSSTDCSSDGNGGVDHLLAVVIDILSLVVGVIAVIMVIVGGLKFITSNGDSGNTASARNTIIYALVGLVIVALAQGLVHFVLEKTVPTPAATAPPVSNTCQSGGNTVVAC